MTLLERIGPWAQLAVSTLVIVAFMGAIVGLFLIDRDLMPGVREVLLVLIGVLAGAFKDVIGFWVGSSYGSAKKTDQLAAERLAP
jgi:uncharacterized protein YqgC (DUF456 family)